MIKEKKLDKSRNESLKDKIMGIFKDETPDRAGEITKTKVYEAKPLSIEDAKLKLMDKKEDLFIVFNNVETNEINVLYKREDGSFGIVVPE